MKQLPFDTDLLIEDSVDHRLSIDQISKQWIIFTRKMNSNLMHSSAIEFNSHKRNLSEQRMFARLFTSAFCFRLKSITIIELHLCSCKSCIVGFFDCLVNDKMFWKLPCNSRHIVFAYCTISDDFIDVLKRFVIFCCDKHS